MITRKRLKLFFAVLLFSFLVPLSMGTAAFASSWPGGGTGGSPGGGGNNGGGGSGPDPGNHGPPRDSQSPGSDWSGPGSGDGSDTMFCGSEIGDLRSQCKTTTTTVNGAGGGCAARSAPGAFGGENIGYTEKTMESRQIQVENGTIVEGAEWSNWRELSRVTVSCYYAESWNEATLHCVERSDIDIDKILPNSRNMASISQPTAFAGNQTIQNCLSSGQYITLSVDIDEFGRYLADASTQGRNCTARYYQSSNQLTGERPADSIVSCGGLYTMHAATNELQVDCVNGVSPSFVDPAEFTAQACLDRNLSQAHCSVGGDPLFNDKARSNDVEAFRDGEANTIEWDPVSIEGSNVVSQKVTSTKMNRSGTPWRSNANSNNQVAYVTHDGSNALGGSIPSNAREFEAGFYQASEGGESNRFQLQPTYDLDVTLRTEKAIITGYDPFNGLNYETAPMNFSTTGDCTAEPINIDVLRSVNG